MLIGFSSFNLKQSNSLIYQSIFSYGICPSDMITTFINLIGANYLRYFYCEWNSQ